MVWDNEAAVGSWRAGRPKLTEEFEGFRGTLGIRVVQCRPADPQAKGLVERANGYLETSFLPGRAFASPADFTAQLDTWLVRANARRHRALGCRPVDRLDADRAAMLPLPPVAPVVGWQRSLRLPRDTTSASTATTTPYTRPRSAPRRRHRRPHAGHRHRHRHCAGRVVAEHARCWAKHQTLTDPAHAAAAVQLRARQSARPRAVDDVEQRALADYDLAFGLDEPARAVAS